MQVPPDPQRGAAGRGSGAEAPRDGGADGGRDGNLLRDHLLPRIYRYVHSELGVIKCSRKQIRPGDFPCCSAGKITRANLIP